MCMCMLHVHVHAARPSHLLLNHTRGLHDPCRLYTPSFRTPPGSTPFAVYPPSPPTPPSRLFGVLDDAVLLGVLPLGLFPNGHSLLLQRTHAKLKLRPYSVRPQLGPLASQHDAASHRLARLAALQAALPHAPPRYAHRASTLERPMPTPRSTRLLLLRVSLPPSGSLLPEAAAVAAAAPAGARHLIAHCRALRLQLAALREGLALALASGRRLVLPALTCYCDHAPSGEAPLLDHLGCKLAGLEAEEYLPFGCPADHVLDAARWREHEVPLYTREMPELYDEVQHGVHRGVRRGVQHEVQQLPPLPRATRVGVRGEGGAAHEGDRDAALVVSRGSAAQLAAALAPLREVPLLELPWRDGSRLVVSSQGGDVAAQRELERLARALLGGPRGGWCAPCGGACRSGLPSMLLQVRASDRRSGRGPDVFCLDFDKLRDAPAAQLELDELHAR